MAATKVSFLQPGAWNGCLKDKHDDGETRFIVGDGIRILFLGNKCHQDGKQIKFRASSINGIKQGNQQTKQQEHPKPRYIFLVATTGRHTLKQLPSLYLSTDEFGQELRQVYRELKGFWRSWFSPHGFSHCDFVRVSHCLHPLLDMIHSSDSRVVPDEFRRRWS